MWPVDLIPERDVDEVPLGAGVGPIDSPPPTEPTETAGVTMTASSLSEYDRLLVREVATLVVAEVWHLLRLAGVVANPPARRPVRGGAGHSSRSAPYGPGVSRPSAHVGSSVGDVMEPMGDAMVAAVNGGLTPPPPGGHVGSEMVVAPVYEEEEEAFPDELWDVTPPGSPRLAAD